MCQCRCGFAAVGLPFPQASASFKPACYILSEPAEPAAGWFQLRGTARCISLLVSFDVDAAGGLSSSRLWRRFCSSQSLRGCWRAAAASVSHRRRPFLGHMVVATQHTPSELTPTTPDMAPHTTMALALQVSRVRGVVGRGFPLTTRPSYLLNVWGLTVSVWARVSVLQLMCL